MMHSGITYLVLKRGLTSQHPEFTNAAFETNIWLFFFLKRFLQMMTI